MKKIRLSLVIPCYNEVINIQKGVLDRIGNYTRDEDSFQEVIIVDDGSTDETKKMIREKYLKNFKKFKLIESSHKGKASAVIMGIENAQCPYVMFSDIDLATPIEESEKLIALSERNYPIVIGSRSSQRKDAPFSRKILAIGFIFVRDILIGLNGIKDTQCGFKIFETKAARSIISKLKVSRKSKKITSSSVSASFDLEFLFLALKLGYKIKEIPVLWRHVETKNVNFFHDAIETLKDIFKIKYYDLSKKYDN